MKEVSKPEKNELSAKARGGTELMMEALYNHVEPKLLKKFQIIPSRVRTLDPDKLRILYCHDLADDPETQVLANGGWRKFHKIIFVSHWQQQQYISKYQIPWSRTTVLKNAINPFSVDIDNKFSDIEDKEINVVYHSTPHRGLELLVPAFEELEDKNTHLHVFSSFNLYGWPERDKPYQDLFDRIKNNERMTYYGAVDNDTLREHLAKMHVFAYPSIWPETSCISLIEAMAAGVCCIHPTYAALPETSCNLTFMYDMHEDPAEHAKIMQEALNVMLMAIRRDAGIKHRAQYVSQYANIFYNWDLRKREWEILLTELLQNPPESSLDESADDVFTYSA